MGKLSLIFISALLILVANSQLPPGFVYLRDVDPTILQEIRYFTYHNFVGRPIVGYNAPECILQIPAAIGLAQIQQEMLSYGFTLKVYDCYRPTQAVQDFYNWSLNNDTTMKEEFYPNLSKSQLFNGYIANKSNHSRGATSDLTIVPLPPKPEPVYIPGQTLYPCTNPANERWPDNMIDMGTGFDCLDPQANTNSSLVNKTQTDHRYFLRSIMTKYNFVNYVNEWWHYTLLNDLYPNTYFNFTIDPRPNSTLYNN